MLEESEKTECLKILQLLSDDNLISLTDTVTGRVVTVENREEALNAIMIYTRNGEELLKRRKVRREHLYQYLAQEGHVEHPAADKITLLKKVLKFWESKKQKSDLEDENCPQVPAVNEEESSQDNITETNSASSCSQTVTAKLHDGDEGQLLAVHFSAWFYKMLESLSKRAPGQANPDWGPQHFWLDATFTVQCNEPSGIQETTVEGAQLVSDKFLSMTLVDQLCLNPNPDSVRGKQNPHGLTLVMVCGTVHRQKEYVGVFEQTFGLIRDPSEANNWKVKFSKLLLKASESRSAKQLEGST